MPGMYDVRQMPTGQFTGQERSSDIAGPHFHASPMFSDIGADYFDFERSHAGPVCYRDPRLASEGKRVHRIGNHDSANAQVIFCDRVPHAVTRIINGPIHDSGGAERLLDRIDPEM